MAKKRELPQNLVEDAFKAGYKGDEIMNESEETPQVKSNDGRTQRIMGNAAMGYQIIDERKEEIRSKRIQIVIKPSVNEKLDEYAADGVIKSKNDLVNQLLEKFIEQQG